MFRRKKHSRNMDTKKNGTAKDDTDKELPKEESPEILSPENDNKSAPDEQSKTAELEAKLNEINDKYMRLYSEFDNFKKRTLKERIELIKSAGEDVFKLILPLLDDFERAVKANENAGDVKTVNEGIALVYQKFQTTFNSRGLEEMKALGEAFNPDLHEAVTNAPAPSENLKGSVIEVIEKGYLLNGKVIRYAKVIVGS